MKTKTVHIIAGPTASGKSIKALELAKKLDGVIINCDSLQIYNDLPILTSQPSKQDKKIVPHKLYPTRSFQESSLTCFHYNRRTIRVNQFRR